MSPIRITSQHPVPRLWRGLRRAMNRLRGDRATLLALNARLAEEAAWRREAAETLRRIGEAVSGSLELSEVLRLCAELTVEQSIAEGVSIYLFEDGTDVFRPVMRCSTADPSRPHDTDDPVPPTTLAQMPGLARAVESGAPVLIDDVSGSGLLRRFEVEHYGARSAAIYPLRAAQDLVGALILDTSEPGACFPDEEVRLMEQIAGQTAIAIRQARLHVEAREHAERTRELLELTKAMTRTFDFEVILSHIVSALRVRMNAERVTVLEPDERGDFRPLRFVTDHSQPVPFDRILATDGVRRLVQGILQQGSVVIDAPAQHPALAPYVLADTRSLLLTGVGETGGIELVMAVASNDENAYTGSDAAFCEGLVDVLALALRNARLYDEARRAAERDSLTGLLNRRMFWPQLTTHVEHATQDHPTALAVLDIDDFKVVNDRYGHDAGDRALRHVTDRLLRNVRETDHVYRLGGEEFTVVMPRTTADEARGVLERVVSALGRTRRDVPRLTVSIGIALAPDQGMTGDSLFRAADRSLYAAKRAGKNRIVLA